MKTCEITKIDSEHYLMSRKDPGGIRHKWVVTVADTLVLAYSYPDCDTIPELLFVKDSQSMMERRAEELDELVRDMFDNYPETWDDYKKLCSPSKIVNYSEAFIIEAIGDDFKWVKCQMASK